MLKLFSTRKLSIFQYQTFEPYFSPYKEFCNLQTSFSYPSRTYPLGCFMKMTSFKSPFRNAFLKSTWYTSKSLITIITNNTNVNKLHHWSKCIVKVYFVFLCRNFSYESRLVVYNLTTSIPLSSKHPLTTNSFPSC